MTDRFIGIQNCKLYNLNNSRIWMLHISSQLKLKTSPFFRSSLFLEDFLSESSKIVLVFITVKTKCCEVHPEAGRNTQQPRVPPTNYWKPFWNMFDLLPPQHLFIAYTFCPSQGNLNTGAGDLPVYIIYEQPRKVGFKYINCNFSPNDK
jgi:hypothetical protein